MNDKISYLRVSSAPKPKGSYSQAIVAGGFVFISGQAPFNPDTESLELESIEKQTKTIMGNITNILSEAGCKMSDIVKTTVHLSNLKYRDEFDKSYKIYFNHGLPARILVGSVLNGFDVEIDVIAYRGVL